MWIDFLSLLVVPAAALALVWAVRRDMRRHPPKRRPLSQSAGADGEPGHVDVSERSRKMESRPQGVRSGTAVVRTSSGVLKGGSAVIRRRVESRERRG